MERGGVLYCTYIFQFTQQYCAVEQLCVLNWLYYIHNTLYAEKNIHILLHLNKNYINTCWPRFQNSEKRLLASSCLSICPFVRMEQYDSNCTDFHENGYLNIFLETIEETEVGQE